MAGFSERELEKWFEGKMMDVYELLRPYRFRKDHSERDETIRLSNDLYRLLLNYLRSGHYDALSFLVHRECSYCVKPNIKGREGLCAIPESSRNKPRSLRVLGFECANFNVASYSHNTVSIIWRKKPQ
jgi:hypothetical protein